MHSADLKYKISTWQPIIGEILTFCLLRRKKEPSRKLQSLLDCIAQSNDWQGIVPAIQNILDGERNIHTLRPDLNTTEYVIVHTILAQLAEIEPALQPDVLQFTHELTVNSGAVEIETEPEPGV